MIEPAALESRVLILARHGADAELTARLLTREQIVSHRCADLDELALEIARGAGCAIVAIESIAGDRGGLAEVLAQQPPWSDFPIIVLTAGPVPSQTSLDWLGKLFLLDRPLTIRALLTTVRTALRARARQYEARAAIAQRDQFLAMLGHELRNPLAAILLASELGDATAGPAPDPGQIARRLATIRRQANHLARLVDDLLDVARVTSGKIVLQRARVDAADAVAGCVAALVGFARERGVTVTVEPPATPISLSADPLRLAQIVDNLLTNAIKYTRRGGHVTASVAREGATCTIRVRDDGIGIAPEMLPRIFDLFTQVDRTLDRANGGMGIGLTLVRRLVELHGGSVEAASAGIGQGSELTVRLPLATASTQAAEQSGPVAVPARAGAGLRAVLVDDNDDLRELGRELLERLGCEVETAADGPAGLAQILRTRPELALVDIGLPGLSGFEVAQAVREQLGEAPYLVAVTGYGQAADRARALAAGFDSHLTKPVRGAAFAEVVAAAKQRAA